MSIRNFLVKTLGIVCVVAAFSTSENTFAQCGGWRGCGLFGWRRAATCSPYRYARTCGSYGASCSTGSCSANSCSTGSCAVPETIPTPTPDSAPSCSGGSCSAAPSPVAVRDLSALEADVIAKANAERARRGRAPLALDSLRTESARRLAQANSRAGVSFHWAGPLSFCGGEICAPGATSADAIRMWLASSGHYALMTSPSYSRASAGVAARTYRRGGREYATYFWVIQLW